MDKFAPIDVRAIVIPGHKVVLRPWPRTRLRIRWPIVFMYLIALGLMFASMVIQSDPPRSALVAADVVVVLLLAVFVRPSKAVSSLSFSKAEAKR